MLQRQGMPVFMLFAGKDMPAGGAGEVRFMTEQRKGMNRMKPVLLLVTYTAKPGMRENFLQEVEENRILEAIRGEDGCISYDYFLAAEDGDCLLLVEKWATGEQQKTHMAQPHMKTLAEIKGRWIAQTSIERIDLEEEKQN